MDLELPRFRHPKDLRLARTATPRSSGSSYPDYSTRCQKLWIEFQDATSSGTEPDWTLSTTSRQASGPQVQAHNLAGGYLPVGTLVLVWWFQGEWWIVQAFAKPLLFELTAALLPGGSATAYPVGEDGSVDETQTVTLYDLTATHWGVPGERLEGRCRGSQWEAVSSGGPWHLATLAEALAPGGTAEVTMGTRGRSATVEVTDVFLAEGDSLAEGQAIGCEIDTDHARWVATEAQCE